MRKALLVSLIALTVQGCGGGSGSSTPSPTPSPSPVPTPVPTPDNDPVEPLKTVDGISYFGVSEAIQGQSVSFGVKAENGEGLRTVSWSQTAGPEVTILAPDTQMIGFDAVDFGDYTFDVTVQTTSGQTVTETIELTVIDTLPAQANVRLDHTASETAKVSLRVDGIDGKVIDSINWQQVAGPGVNNLEIQENLLFFDAPSVNQDTVVEFQATVSFVDGTSATDNGLVLIKNVEIEEDGYFPRFNEQVVTTDIKPYNPNSPYAAALELCIYNNTVNRSCQFSSLPLLGTDTTNPTIQQVLDRLLVSHDWMGDRFKQYLEQSVAAPDMLKLLRAVTAIVISYDVRPSYYWSATGAIYLDANNFWVTPEERDSLNDQPDYRSDFGNDLKFFIPWRYIKDNEYYFRSTDYPVEERQSKSFEDMEANITWLMYHELGHANDFFPPTVWQSMSRNTSPLNYSNDNEAMSSAFAQRHPLTSQAMRSLAQVSFMGETASDTQKNYDAQTVTDFFEPDVAPAYYSYSTIREDYATLFERFMMAHRMGVSADVAVISTEQEGFSVTWGQRNRISLDKMRQRTSDVVEQTLPELNVSAIYPTLPEAQLMPQGEDWRDLADLTGTQDKSLSRKGINRDKPEWFIGVHHKLPGNPKQ